MMVKKWGGAKSTNRQIMITDETNDGKIYLNYEKIRNEQFKEMKARYKQTKQVEFSKTNHYVKVGGVVYNGISKEEFEQCIGEELQ